MKGSSKVDNDTKKIETITHYGMLKSYLFDKEKYDYDKVSDFVINIANKDIATYIDPITGNSALHLLSGIETRNLADANKLALIMKELFKNGANPNVQNNEGITPLLLASKNSNYVLSKLLLENEANPNITGNLGESPLAVLIYNGADSPSYYHLIKLLIKYDANVDIEYQGKSLLEYAASKEGMVVHKFLLEAGAPVNKTNINGDTPLHIAAKLKYRDKYKDFQKFKPNQAIRNKKGKAFDDYDSTLATTRPQQNNQSISHSLPLSIINPKFGNAYLYIAIREFIENGGDINAPYKLGKTFYNTLINYIASRKPSYYAIKELLDNGVDPDGEFDRVRPLHSICKSLTNDKSPWAQHEIADIVALLVEKGADINAKDINGKTPLYLIVENGGSAELIKELIELGADKNMLDHDGKLSSELTLDKEILEALNYKPVSRYNCHINCRHKSRLSQQLADQLGKQLIIALQYNNTKKAEDLIWQGANLNYALSGFNTVYPILVAARYGNVKIMELLLDGGADIMLADRYGATAIHYAADADFYVEKEIKKEMIKLLLNKGVNINLADNNGDTPAHYAVIIENYDKDFADYLYTKKADFKLQNKEGKSAEDLMLEYKKEDYLARELLLALRNKDTHKAKNLIMQGANVNYQEIGTLWSPILIATKEENLEIIKLLAHKGADLDKGDRFGTTAVHFAAERENIEIIEFLIQKHCDINKCNKFKQTAMHLAVQAQAHDSIKFLLDNGANLHAEDIHRDTPAHYLIILAKKQENVSKDKTNLTNILVEELEFLRENGADLSLENSSGKSALDNLEEYFDAETALGENLLTAIRSKIVSKVNYLVDKGANINYAEIESGRQPIHHAAIAGNLEILQLLLDKGVNPSSQDKYGSTAIDYAIELGNQEVVDFLITQGIEVNSQDKNGKKAASRALKAIRQTKITPPPSDPVAMNLDYNPYSENENYLFDATTSPTSHDPASTYDDGPAEAYDNCTATTEAVTWTSKIMKKPPILNIDSLTTNNLRDTSSQVTPRSSPRTPSEKDSQSPVR
jgi:serine/threonine-protein phosphatase 6 regulatory ankyrin repeat subunit B